MYMKSLKYTPRRRTLNHLKSMFILSNTNIVMTMKRIKVLKNSFKPFLNKSIESFHSKVFFTSNHSKFIKSGKN